jgi:hypothetical protein
MRHQKNLAEMISIQWVAVLGGIAGIVALFVPPDSPLKWWLLGLLTLLVVVFVIVEGQRHRLSVFSSGLVEYIRSFPENRNAEVLEDVSREYCYLGVTFSTFLTSFCNWFERHRKGQVKVRLLLADPDDLAMFQAEARYLSGGSAATEEQIHRLAQQRIQELTAALRRMARLADRTHIEVRFHKQLLHEWMHIVDDRQLAVGLLRHGEDGLECPVAVLRRMAQPGLFDHYHGWFEYLWQASEKRTVDWEAYK